MKKLLFLGLVWISLALCITTFFGAFRHGKAASMKNGLRTGSTIAQAEDIGAKFSKDDAQPFLFSTGSLSNTITQHAISPAADANYLLEHYKACGPKYRPASYFPDVAHTMRKLPETKYSIGTFQIILIPNLLGYKNFPAVQEDFFACPGATGVLVPAAMNDSWLVFTRSCPASDDACKQASEIISPTIRLK